MMSNMTSDPYTFGYFDLGRLTGVSGGHVSVGGLFYDADALPHRLTEMRH
jgi:hypothetical protein